MTTNIQIKCPKDGNTCTINLDEQLSNKLEEEIDKITKNKDEENQKLREQINEKDESYRKKLEEYREIGKQDGKNEAIRDLNYKHEREIREKTELHQTELKEKSLQIEKLNKSIENAAKQVNKTSIDILGKCGEDDIIDLIHSTFPNDKTELIPKRKGGADVIHTIIEGNHNCGIILYECKRTESYEKSWINKLKEDSIEIKSDFNVIVTKTMPTDNTKPHNIDNVWIVSFYDIEGVVRLLRDSIVRLDITYNSQSDGSLKREELYNYITSIEYNRKTEIVLGKLNERRKKQEKKKTEFVNYWKKEIEETNSLILDLNEIFCSIEGIRDRCLDKSELIIIENKK